MRGLFQDGSQDVLQARQGDDGQRLRAGGTALVARIRAQGGHQSGDHYQLGSERQATFMVRVNLLNPSPRQPREVCRGCGGG